MVYTESFKEVMEKLDIAVQVDCPIIIEGEASVGKSTLLEAYASIKNKGKNLTDLGFSVSMYRICFNQRWRTD